MIQGTSSSAGKSALTAGLLRYFSSAGFNSSPFKSQNMSLNSIVTEDGYEIAVSQAVQSEAAFKKPGPNTNPILLKPSGDNKIHLVLHGKYFGNTNFKEYNRNKDFFLKKAKESFDILSNENDLIVVEGAGSPAEINLYKFDIANMGFAEIYDIPVILVADIERGGVFASIFGTVKLLPPRWRKLVKGFIVNKFRGDLSILDPGIKSMEKMLKIPCLGVMPYIKNLRLEPEDSLEVHSFSRYTPNPGEEYKNENRIKIGIVKLEHISNFNEFEPLFSDKRFHTRFFSVIPDDPDEFDIIIIPGTKTTLEDMALLKKSGVFDYIRNFSATGEGLLIGVCGGFQMMGRFIKDPMNIESEIDFAEGLGIFDLFTVMQKNKSLFNRKYRFDAGGFKGALTGYEIHNGKTMLTQTARAGKNDFNINLFRPDRQPVSNADNRETPIDYGVISHDGKKMGTYIHGLFSNDLFRDYIAAAVGGKNSGKSCFASKTPGGSFDYGKFKNGNYDLLAEVIGKNIMCDRVKDLFTRRA